MTDELWVIATGILVGISCSLVGVFLVLRRLAMLGDAISHSVLFGIVVAFLVTSSRDPLTMMIGAGCVGLLTAYLTNFLNVRGKLQEDASVGVTFTWLFALGVILISLFAGQVDIDQECVLFGEIAFVPFTRMMLFGIDFGPRAFFILLVVTLLDLAFVTIGFRSLKALSFDRVLSMTMGVRVTLWHYLLMSFVSITTVAAFESVGAILVVAMLVVPPNAAYLVARSLSEMVWLSVLFSIIASVSGYFLAAYFDASISAGIALMAGAILILTILLTAGREQLQRSQRPMEIPVGGAQLPG